LVRKYDLSFNFVSYFSLISRDSRKRTKSWLRD